MKKNLPHVDQMFQDWFLDYASYVITDRAIPSQFDGLKPVQRRILHSMKELDDGRFHKVANIVGHTMKYHPHGDASIYSALVNLGQKNLLVDTQGNWGDQVTGDPAAAARYIEAKLSKFALEVVFNPQLTKWQKSYDGRNKEPVTLPLKFPLVLAIGIDGIAVGLSTKVLPHNVTEILNASICHLRGTDFVLYPDFPHGGIADVSNYQGGARGGKVRVRARLSNPEKNLIEISEIPYSVTTQSLIESILSANEKNKIKITRLEDSTAENVSIQLFLPKGSDFEMVTHQLYAFTDCEVSLSPMACVIQDRRPIFPTVEELLARCTEEIKDLLQLELELKRDALLLKWHHKTLERIFIENEIYEQIKVCVSDEDIYRTIETALIPFTDQVRRPIAREDVIKLTEIKIKRISKFDTDAADQELRQIELEIEKINASLADMTGTTIKHFQDLKKRYGKQFPRRTELATFETVNATEVARTTCKLMLNTKGYLGTDLKTGEFICNCSELDEILVIQKSGAYKLIKVPTKAYIGEDIIFVDRFLKTSKLVYNLIYWDDESRCSYVKRFHISSLIREKEYQLFEKGKLLYFSTNSDETVRIKLIGNRIRNNALTLNWSDYLVKGKASRGNQLTKHIISNIKAKSNKPKSEGTPPTSEEQLQQGALFNPSSEK